MNTLSTDHLSITEKHTLEMEGVAYALLTNEGECDAVINGTTIIRAGDGREYPAISGHLYSGDVKIEFASGAKPRLDIFIIKSVPKTC